MSSAFTVPTGKPRFYSSLGVKMLSVAILLLVLSFAVCSAAFFLLTRRMLEDSLQDSVSKGSRYLSTASQDVLTKITPEGKQRLRGLASSYLDRPEFLSVAILDRNKRVIVQASRAIPASAAPFSLQVPIMNNAHQRVGWVRAWYSPGLAIEEFWRLANDLVVVLFCGILVLFVVVFLAVNEWIMVRPFRRLLSAIDTVESSNALIPVELPNRHDEWGTLASRLNRFLARGIELQDQTHVLNETSRLLGLPWELKGAMEGILTEMLHRYNLSSCLVFGPVNETELRVRYATGISESLANTLRVQFGEGAGGIAYASATHRMISEFNGAESNDPLLKELVQRQQVRSALFMPMEGDGRTWGVAAYFSRTAHNFPESTQNSLKSFTQQLALAFRNAQWMSELKEANQGLEQQVNATSGELNKTQQRLIQKVRELKTIYDLALATAAFTQVEDTVQVIIRSVKELVDVGSAAFFLYDRSSGRLEPLMPTFDRTPEQAQMLSCRLEESKLLERVIKEGLPQMLNFVEPTDQLPASWNEISIRSILALPLRQGDQVAGLFCVINKTNGLFSDDDVRLLSLLTSRVAEVLNRVALDQQVRQRVQDLSLLQDIALHLPSPPILVDTVNTIARISRGALSGADLCLFFLHHVESEALAVMGGDWDPQLQFDPKALTLGTSEPRPLSEVFRERQMASYGSMTSAAGWEKDELVQVVGLQEVLYLPLVVEQQTIGVMAVGGQRKGGLNPQTRRVAALIAEQVAVIIERSRLYEKLRSANEKLEQINHLKNEFISMVSHELRTPLTTIKGFVSIVLSGETGPLKPQQKYFLETSDRAIDRLTLLVSDLLDISRLEAGQIQMQLRPISIQDLIIRVGGNFEPQLKAQNLTFKMDIPEKLPMVLADPHRLTQVFDNLMTNALKFTSKGGITISAADKGDFVMVSVRDTGIGLPKTEQERIFDKFYQVKTGSAWPAKGTGLGLAIVKSIVESHRGKVWVESESEKGADFRFLIPRARTGDMPPLPTTGKII